MFYVSNSVQHALNVNSPFKRTKSTKSNVSGTIYVKAAGHFASKTFSRVIRLFVLFLLFVLFCSFVFGFFFGGGGYFLFRWFVLFLLCFFFFLFFLNALFAFFCLFVFFCKISLLYLLIKFHIWLKREFIHLLDKIFV